LEVRNDVGYGGMRWITVALPTSPARPSSCIRRPPPRHHRRRAPHQADGAEVVKEPTDQPYGIRDCAFRDPAGNMIRIQELR
jgi:catechol 2,3-dioxygenase-like lactoylglutathione lyase family enzyme